MNKQYRKLFKELIIDKMQTVIIRYDPQKKNYMYNGYSHSHEKSSLDALTKLVIDDIVFYAFSEKEIVEQHQNYNLLDDLRDAAKYAYVERLPKRENANCDGLLGEVLLDIFIQAYSPNSQKLVIRAKHTEINTKKEITGYDALYFTKDDNGVSFWLGQAKAGEKEYCKSGVVHDLEEKYKKEYFADTAFFIADRKDTDELDNILTGINKICFDSQRKNWDKDKKVEELLGFLKNEKVKLIIPCLLAYTKDIYDDSTKLKEKIEAEVNGIVSYIDKRSFPIETNLDWELLLWIFPIKDVNFIRNELIRLKKEAT